MAAKIENKNYSIEFSENGQLKSIIRKNQNIECVINTNKNDGFYLMQNNNLRIDLDCIEYLDGCMKLYSQKNDLYVMFKIDIQDRYTVFKIIKTNGISKRNKMSFHFKADTNSNVKTLELDYMTTTPFNQKGIDIEISNFNYLPSVHPLGSFAIYTLESEDDEDETLYRIWTNEDIPHPKTSYEWNYEAAKQWINSWITKFSDRTRIILGAQNEEELYEGTEYAYRNGIKEIYLHTDVWRFEYWPYKNRLTHVNKNVFPNGESDLRKYTDYLAERGMYCVIHNVSGGIGFNDPDYVMNDHIDGRLASWGKGILLNDISADTEIIKIKIDTDIEIPVIGVGYSDYDRMPILPGFFDYKLMRIENELIEVSKIEDMGEYWELTISQRGQYDTKSVKHSKNNEIVGLIRAYGMNLVPDNDSDLIDEIAEKYASMLNRTGVSGAEYDGGEIHCYNGGYGYKEFAWKLYPCLDHCVVAHDSGAVMPHCHLEYRFNSVKRKYFGGPDVVPSSGGEGVVCLILRQIGRDATIPMELQYYMNYGLLKNTHRYGIQKPEPMFGVTSKMLETYGYSNECLQTLSNWKKISDNMNEQTKELIEKSYQAHPTHFAMQSMATEVIFDGKEVDGNFTITPTRAMTDDNTINWQSGVEHGCLYPAQYIKVGESIELYNHYDEQVPSFYIKTKAAFNYDSIRNKSLMPKVEDILSKGDYCFTEKNDAIEMSFVNNSNEERWEVDRIPVWKQLLSMKRRRGIGLYVKGDASGAVLVVCIPGGDYPIKIDFIGYKYIEIPDAQYSWRQNYWGWRMDTKHINYLVNYVGIHFGYIPANINPKVEIKGLKALNELKQPLVNPVISTDFGTIHVEGEIPFDGILHFDGKKSFIRDENWKIIYKPKVLIENFKVGKGKNSVKITSDNVVSNFLEVQFLTKDKEFSIN
jgi:hypothetical protein